MAGLKEEHKTHIVTSLACFSTLKQVIEEMQAVYGVTVTPQQVQYYDPTKGSTDKRLGKKWRHLFDKAREVFISDTAAVGVAHQSYRLRVLQRLLDAAIDNGLANKGLVLDILERGAKEKGGFYTNKREHSGPGGGAIPLSVEDKKKDLAGQMLRKLMDKGDSEEQARAKLVSMGVNERDIPAVRNS
jgi:hypothetical protein